MPKSSVLKFITQQKGDIVSVNVEGAGAVCYRGHIGEAEGGGNPHTIVLAVGQAGEETPLEIHMVEATAEKVDGFVGLDDFGREIGRGVLAGVDVDVYGRAGGYGKLEVAGKFEIIP